MCCSCPQGMRDAGVVHHFARARPVHLHLCTAANAVVANSMLWLLQAQSEGAPMVSADQQCAANTFCLALAQHRRWRTITSTLHMTSLAMLLTKMCTNTKFAPCTDVAAVLLQQLWSPGLNNLHAVCMMFAASTYI